MYSTPPPQCLACPVARARQALTFLYMKQVVYYRPPCLTFNAIMYFVVHYFGWQARKIFWKHSSERPYKAERASTHGPKYGAQSATELTTRLCTGFFWRRRNQLARSGSTSRRERGAEPSSILFAYTIERGNHERASRVKDASSSAHKCTQNRHWGSACSNGRETDERGECTATQIPTKSWRTRASVTRVGKEYELSKPARKIMSTFTVTRDQEKVSTFRVDYAEVFVVLPFSQPWSDDVFSGGRYLKNLVLLPRGFLIEQ